MNFTTSEHFQIKPIEIIANDLTLTISSSKSSPKPILKNLTFKTCPGQIVAILGSSGSGKTTCLNLLAGRIQSTSGSLTFNNLPPKLFYDNGSCGYVQQHDYLIPYLTVRESLRFTARLRLDRSLSLQEKYDAVESVIAELGLSECADRIIGDEWQKGLSGGEKRRVTVASQLLLNPSILFLDEPTTGLDAFTSFNLVETLKGLALRGRTVFITIHQPRSDISHLFDSVILLAKGELVYTGKAGDTMLGYFAGKGYKCEENVNPADFVVDVMSIDDRSEADEVKSLERVNVLIQAWKEVKENGKEFEMEPRKEIADLRKKSMENVNAQKDGSTAVSVGYSGSIKKREYASPLSQIYILTIRNWRNQLRDNLMLWGNLMECTLVGLFFGIIFFRLGSNLTDVLTRKAALYIVASIQTYLQLIFSIYKTCSELKVFDRERGDKIYSVLPFVCAQFIAQLPFNILFPTVYAVISYFVIGLRTDDLAIHLFRFVIANILSHFVIYAFSLFSVALARDFATSSLIANSMFTFFSFSAGYFIQLDSVPPGLRWIASVDFLTFQYKLMASNEFSNNVFECADAGAPCQGNDVLRSLGIGVDSYIYPIIGLVCSFLAFMVLSTTILYVYTPARQSHASPKNPKISSYAGRGEDVEMPDNNRKVGVEIVGLGLELTQQSKFSKTSTSKVLLDKISCKFPTSSLSIIMGSSGSGKSTLLSLLCGRSLRLASGTKLKIQGQILYNSKPLKPQAVTSICSFVRQSDEHLLPALTCRETLEFAAKLRLPESMPLADKLARADKILNTLGLRHCADTVVGSETVKGLSGGEKRRLSIGIQMITDPSILVIDEPTSGLDAFTARHIMETLKKIAETGRTVICSIHQPRSDIFAIFDEILLLAKLGSGRVAYTGPSNGIVPYFAKLGLNLPKFCNPGDFILDITSIDFRNEAAEVESKKRLSLVVESWEKTSSKKIEDLEKQEVVSDLEEVKPKTMISFMKAFPILSHRSYLNSIRQPLIIIARILQVVFLGIIMALYYARQGNSQASVQNRIGVLQQSLSVLFVGLLNCVAVFPAERNILLYEYSDRAYAVEPFFLAYIFIEVPIEFVSAALFSVFAMIVVGLNLSVQNYFCMVLTVFCLTNFGESIGIAFCSLVEHVGFSVSITNSVLGILTVMSGIMSANMPIFLDRINRISPVPYLCRLMTINEFDEASQFTCTAEEIASRTCFYRNGTDVLNLLASSTSDVLKFERSKFVFYIIVGTALTVAYRFLAYLVLSYRASRSS